MELPLYEVLGFQGTIYTMTASFSRNDRAIVVFSGRFPSEKADELFAYENAKAFSELGVDTILLAPRRLGRGAPSKGSYKTVYLPTLDLSWIPLVWEIASYVNLLVFSCAVYVWLHKIAHPDDFVLCNEPLPLLFASLAVRRTLFEIHIVPVRNQWLYRILFRRIALALPINAWNAKLAERHGLSRERIVIARSAVDTEVFRVMDKTDARSKLGLPLDARVAVYTGHLFAWKGVDMLAETARLVPEIRVVFVGGTERDVTRFREMYGSLPNVVVVGFVPHDQVPLWQAAADVLVIPNSGKTKISRHYTSPMKLFEYMASSRPILASDLPSVREILTEETGYFATPDDADSFARTLDRIFSNPEEALRKARAARSLAENNTWEQRAERILKAVATI
jgi:glycosyltransferase involved in cell wall biosynthesis